LVFPHPSLIIPLHFPATILKKVLGVCAMKNRINMTKQYPSPTNPLSATNTISSYQESQTKRLLGWSILPLRLFLGITFIYAGIQKLTDPQYFHPLATRYIGNQIAAFATTSPIHNFLVNVAEPHAMLVGTLVAYGEFTIGLGTLLGLFLRPAALFGILLNTLFFLSATWRVYPYFYGSDIVFIFCWITLLIVGPVSSVLPTPDAFIAPRLLKLVSPGQREQFARVLHIILGVREPPASVPVIDHKQPPVNPRRNSRAQASLRRESRRNFIWGMLIGGAGTLGLVWLGSLFRIAPQPSDGTATTPIGAIPPPAGDLSSTPGTSSVIAQVSQIPINSATTFTFPSNGDPSVLIHLNNDQFVAYDAVCTHAGCPVSYDSGSKLLLCPCHGAEFDPAKGAAVVQGPAQTPLTSIPINVDNSTGTISLSN
jgi:thiosulfate dehydrogenase [quinone] large subunit